jgi:hypothetical protein
MLEPEVTSNDDFYTGPETGLSLWNGGRLDVLTDQGPCTYLNLVPWLASLNLVMFSLLTPKT